MHTSDLHKPELEGKSRLMNGPFREVGTIGTYDKYFKPIGGGIIRIPLDDNCKITSGDAALYAVYDMHEGSGDVVPFFFERYTRFDGQPFRAQFLDGPCAGIREVHQPVCALSDALIPLPREPPDGGRRVRVTAHYRRVGNAMHYVQTHRQVTPDLRVLFTLRGGALDGRVFDTDAMSLDQVGATSAQGWYAASDHGLVGTRMSIINPYSWQIFDEFDDDSGLAVSQVYEIVSREYLNCEVHLIAEYRGTSA